MRVVEKIPWPEPSPVDLLAEFGTILGDVPVRRTPPPLARFEAKVNRLKQVSPYAESVVERPPKATLSPAQVAARRVRKMALEHLQYDINQEVAGASTPESLAFDLKTWLRELDECASSLDAPAKPSKGVGSAPALVLVPVTSEQAPAPQQRSPPRQSSRLQSPPRQSSHKKSPTRQSPPQHRRQSPPRGSEAVPGQLSELDEDENDPEYIRPFAHLEPQDLKSMQNSKALSPPKPDRQAKQFQVARWLSQRIRNRVYSKEVQARLASALHANPGLGLWKDEVASRLATEMSADTVFGDGSEGNARPFAEDAEAFATALERDWIDRKARDIKGRAATEYADGHVAAALTTLANGAALMSAAGVAPPTKSSWGFNYTLEAHALATTIQMLYRRRHRRRVRATWRLQTAWRGFHARRAYARRRWLRQESAVYIQRWWHVHTADKEAMRLRIQTAARRKLARLRVVRLHRATKCLHKWVRLWLVRALARIRLGRASRASTAITRVVRGFLGRRRVRWLRKVIAADEVTRLTQEEAYIERFSTIRLKDFNLYLAEAGVRRVRDLAKKLKADDALRARSRVHWTPTQLRRARLQDVFASYDMDGSGTIDADELKPLFDELGIPMDRAELDRALAAMDESGDGVVDVDEFCAYLEAPERAGGPAGLWLLKAQLGLRAVANWFTAATYKAHARRRLAHEERTRLRPELRQAFRADYPPRFACPLCHAPFCFYMPFWQHTRRRACRRAVASAEADAIAIDEDNLLAEDEQELVDARLAQVEREVFLYLATPPGERVLKTDAARLDAFVEGISRKQPARQLVRDAAAARELFYAHDVVETDAIDVYVAWNVSGGCRTRRFAFQDVMHELGLALGTKEFAACFAAIDSETAGCISCERFLSWLQRSPHLFTWRSRLSQALRRFWTRKATRRTRQAAACILSRERAIAEEEVRATYRAAHPPVAVCPLCFAGFWREEQGLLHAEDTWLHQRDAAYRLRRDKRIGLAADTSSVLHDAAKAHVEADRAQRARKARHFCRRREGRRAISAVASHVLQQLQLAKGRTKGSGKLFDLLFNLLDVDRAGAIATAAVGPLLTFFEYPSVAAALPALLPILDPDASGRVSHAAFVSWFEAVGKAEIEAVASEGFPSHLLQPLLLRLRVRRLATFIVGSTYAAPGRTLAHIVHLGGGDIDAYLASAQGQLAILDEDARIRVLQSRDRLPRAMLVGRLFDFANNASVAVRDLPAVLRALHYPSDVSTVRAVMSAQSSGSAAVAYGALLSWLARATARDKVFALKYCVVRLWHALQRQPRRRLATSVVAARYRRQLLEEVAPEAAASESPPAHLVIAKSEQYCESSVGKAAIAAKVAELAPLQRAFAAATRGRPLHEWRHARASFLFRLFEKQHPGAVEVQDLSMILRHLCHPSAREPNAPLRLLRFLNLDASTTTVSETAFHRWLDTDGSKVQPRRWRYWVRTPSLKELATAVVRFEYRQALEAATQPSVALDFVAKVDAYCSSIAGQHAIDDEENRVRALYEQVARRTALATTAERAEANATLLFRLFDLDSSGFVDAAELATLLQFLSLPHDPLAVDHVLRTVNADGALSEAAFCAWCRPVLAKSVVLVHRQLGKQLRAVAQSIVAARYRQTLFKAR
ncbi:hypothetical protein ACHHYP_10464 [Achlya hypogyna]|uniref:Calmodulin n=1 Tax=Achlya hypogyna TaxID=1202772 RepID=A0A1V9YLD2_ACHHY|nr:hypothetical protein ACHHYP_10464 [Achlya hypogyna]